MSSTYVNIPSGSEVLNNILAGTNITIARTATDITINATSTSSSPGGSNTQVQFNDSNAFGGTSDFTFNKTSKSVTIGAASVAPGINSMSIGPNRADGAGSFAGGAANSEASGNNSIAWGYNCKAQNGQSTSFGDSNTSLGSTSFSIGESNTSSGSHSISAGKNSTASGNYAQALGFQTLAHADNQTVFGLNNVAVGTPSTPLSTDEIFTIGNGASSGSRATALAVLRDGTVQDSSGSVGVASQAFLSNGVGVPPSWQTVVATGGASRALDNLLVVNINIPLQTADDVGTTNDLTLTTGNSSAGDSGNTILDTGTASGTKGAIQIKGGTEGTANQVLISTDTNGSVAWSASIPVWTKYTKTFAQLSAAATSNSITLFSLPAKGVIHEVVFHHTVAFSGGTISAYTISITGPLNTYASSYDVFQAASNTQFRPSLSGNMENFGGASNISLNAVSVGDTLDNAAAGSVDIYVQTSILP